MEVLPGAHSGGRAAPFFAGDYDDSAWASIAVPSNWQLPAVALDGFKDNPIYANVHYTFEPQPPHVPAGQPDRLLPDDVHLGPGMGGPTVLLLFEGVDSNLTLWVNGHEVGYSEDSRLPAEFDITPYVRPGENRIAAQVMRYCDGSYLECQDFWRMSGIQRDVLLYSKPPVCLEDFAVRTWLDGAGGDARLEVEVRLTKPRPPSIRTMSWRPCSMTLKGSLCSRAAARDARHGDGLSAAHAAQDGRGVPGGGHSQPAPRGRPKRRTCTAWC